MLFRSRAVPPDVVTLMKPLPAPTGTLAVICVVELTVKAALTPLKVTAVAALKFVPVRKTLVPGAPLAGENAKITGGGFVWPSTLFRKLLATALGSAVKKVKPVSTSIWLAEVT